MSVESRCLFKSISLVIHFDCIFANVSISHPLLLGDWAVQTGLQSRHTPGSFCSYEGLKLILIYNKKVRELSGSFLFVYFRFCSILIVSFLNISLIRLQGDG